MKFTFRLRNAAVNNNEEAKLRESTRMACLAHGLHQLGHEVSIANVPGVLLESPRIQWFQHLLGHKIPNALNVVPAESLRHGGSCDVAVKCSVSTEHDALYLSRSRLVVAHEADPQCADRTLNVPFLIHDRVIREMGPLFEAYLRDDIEAIRAAWRPAVQTGVAAYSGAGWPLRKQFFADAPEWVEARFYDTHPMGGVEHARWLAGYRGAIVLRGDTPKVNLTPLAVLLGVPVVAPEIERNTPPLDEDSMILFDGWDSLRAVLDDEARCRRIADRATEIYRAGWSPLGQARQIVRALEGR